MERYQRADPEAPRILVEALSPALLRYFRSRAKNLQQADDLLQETWLRIHRVRHTYRPGEPVLPWVYAIARRVSIDGYRRSSRIGMHELAFGFLPEVTAREESSKTGPSFAGMVAALPESQREVLTMLKLGGLSLEEVARATSSTVGSVKQSASRLRDFKRIVWGASAKRPTGGNQWTTLKRKFRRSCWPGLRRRSSET